MGAASSACSADTAWWRWPARCLLLFDGSAAVPGMVERGGRRRFNFWPLLLLFCSTIGFGVSSFCLIMSVMQRLYHGAPLQGSVFPLTTQETNFLIWAVIGGVGRLAALNLGQAAKEITRRRVVRVCLWMAFFAAMLSLQIPLGDWLRGASPTELSSAAFTGKWIGVGVFVVIVLYSISLLFRAIRGVAMPVQKSIVASATSKGLPAAEAWLAILDSGDYARSWEEAYFLRTLGKEEWVSQLEKVRRPLGKVLSRKLSATKVTPTRRRYEARFTFATAFEGLPAATETVTFAVQPKHGVEGHRLPRPPGRRAGTGPGEGRARLVLV